MAKIVEVIAEFGRNVEAVAGTTAREIVMDGSQSLKDSTLPVKVAQWVKQAIHRLDQTLSPEDAQQVMARCGENCARHNQTPIQRAVKRRAKFASLDAFIAAEVASPPPGVRFEQQEGWLDHIYTPSAFTHPMRCYCGLLRGLPAGESVSATYCECSRAFISAYWQAICQTPVQVELIESCVSGAQECRFRVHLQ